MVNSYEADKASQKWSIEGSLVRWHGATAGEWQVVGLKPPVGPDEHNLYLHVGPLDTLVGTQWTKESVYIGTLVFLCYNFILCHVFWDFAVFCRQRVQ